MVAPSEKPKLYYFNLIGLGEAIRLTFTVGKIEFDDVRFDHEAWKNEYKAKSPSGKVPMLEIGKNKYVESNAILSYAARRANILPDKPIALMCMWQAIFSLDSVRTLLHPFYFATADQKKQIEEEVTPKLLEALKLWDSIVGPHQHEAGYLAGDRLTPADLAIYAFIRSVRFPPFALKTDLCHASPVMKKVYDVVDKIPEIKSYYAA